MNRLVILAPNWLGDAVMALPAIADVRRASKSASITIAARASVAPLFSLVPEVDATIVVRRAPLSVAGWHELGVEIAGKGFDTALLLPNSVHAALLTMRAGVAERWGYRTGWRGALLTRAVPSPRGVHQIEYYQQLVRALGFESGAAVPRVTVPPESRAAARALLTSSGWDGATPLVAIAPGAAYGGAKRWPPASFAELVAGLTADGIQCVMIGAAADAATAAEVLRFSPPTRGTREGGPAVINLVGRTDLPMLAGVFASCRGLVTNDSGAMHLAAAIGINITAMFGPTDESATAPRSSSTEYRVPSDARRVPSPEQRVPSNEQRVTILTHPVWCRPCMLRECPIDHRCMRRIAAATVLDAARSNL
jgi:heptosyltransferase-2